VSGESLQVEHDIVKVRMPRVPARTAIIERSTRLRAPVRAIVDFVESSLLESIKLFVLVLRD